MDLIVVGMMSLDEVTKIAKKHRLLLVYLFGSKAQNKETNLSDVDIAVLIQEENNVDLRQLSLDLIFEFSQLFRSGKIDLLMLNKAPLAIQYNVIYHGKNLYYVDVETRENYETTVIKLYLDFKKYETEYYAEMRNKILQDV